VACHFAEQIASGELQPHEVDAQAVSPWSAAGDPLEPLAPVDAYNTPDVGGF
jgi:peptide/nickel transport system ATP-binding protein